MMRKAGLPPSGLEKFPMQSGEEPAFHAPQVAKLMALVAPSIKRLLREIGSIGRIVREAEGKSIKVAIIDVHDFFKLRVGRHHEFSDESIDGAVCFAGAKQVTRDAGTNSPAKCRMRAGDSLRFKKQ